MQLFAHKAFEIVPVVEDEGLAARGLCRVVNILDRTECNCCLQVFLRQSVIDGKLRVHPRPYN